MPNPTNLTKYDKESCAVVAKLYYDEKLRSGLTQKTLGQIIGKSPKTISAIIKGDIRVTLDVGIKLAKFFGVPLTDILPKMAEINVGNTISSELLDDLSELTSENREVARKMIRHLLDSQED